MKKIPVVSHVNSPHVSEKKRGQLTLITIKHLQTWNHDNPSAEIKNTGHISETVTNSLIRDCYIKEPQ